MVQTRLGKESALCGALAQYPGLHAPSTWCEEKGVQELACSLLLESLQVVVADWVPNELAALVRAEPLLGKKDK